MQDLLWAVLQVADKTMEVYCVQCCKQLISQEFSTSEKLFYSHHEKRRVNWHLGSCQREIILNPLWLDHNDKNWNWTGKVREESIVRLVQIWLVDWVGCFPHGAGKHCQEGNQLCWENAGVYNCHCSYLIYNASWLDKTWKLILFRTRYGNEEVVKA